MIKTVETNATYRGRVGLVTSDLTASWTVRRRDRDISVLMTVSVCHKVPYNSI